MPAKPSKPSIPPASKTRIRMEAYTDWLVVVATTGLVAMDKVPWEWGLGIIAAIGGVTGVLKGLGRPGGSAGVVFALLSKLAASGKGIVGVLPFLIACSPAQIQTGVEVGKALAQVAGPVLRELAAQEGAIIDESGAVCFEAPDVTPEGIEGFEDVEVTAVVCFAAHVE